MREVYKWNLEFKNLEFFYYGRKKFKKNKDRCCNQQQDGQDHHGCH